jgi:hypothetical protein
MLALHRSTIEQYPPHQNIKIGRATSGGEVAAKKTGISDEK